MSKKIRRRGRPAGTGIDDTEYLEQIHRLILADSSLRPTTAIRKLGIENASVVRRLRDKYKVLYSAPVSAPADTQTQNRQRSPEIMTATPAAMPLASKDDRARRTAPAAPVDRSLEAARATSIATDIPGFMIAAMSTMVAASNFIAVQQAILWQMSVKGPLATGLAHQAAGTACPACGAKPAKI